MDRRAAWVLGLVFGGMFLILFGFLFVMYLAVRGDAGGRLGGGEKIGVIEVLGPIGDSKKTVEELKEFREAEDVKAIVVRVDSPGGAVGPSQEIYDAILATRQKKSVVVSMGSMAASGGFYIACAGEKVFANKGTLTGSIGVIMQVPNVSGVLKWAGVEMNTITAGNMKDSGSPFRPMTEAEREHFKTMLADVHEQFIEAVKEGRGLSDEDVRPHADGSVFSGKQAKEWKLVDELGGLEAAIAEAASLAKIPGEPEVVYPKKERRFLMDLLNEEEASSMVHKLSQALFSEAGGMGLQFRTPTPRVP